MDHFVKASETRTPGWGLFPREGAAGRRDVCVGFGEDAENAAAEPAGG